MSVEVIHGDMRDVLGRMVAEGKVVQSVVTDPPYHLTNNKRGGTGIASLNLDSPAGRSRVTTGFMGKAWDGGDIAFQPGTWRLCFELLPLGGHLLAFAGTRTYHRMAVAIEEAGFEIRDTIAWLYGSGFPKSLNVSKAIDKAGGVGVEKFKTRLASAVQQSGLSRKKIDELCGFTMRFDTPYEADTVGWGVSLPSPEKWLVIAKVLNLDPSLFQELIDRVWRGRAGAEISGNVAMSGGNFERTDLGEPATDAARQWDGWGTALKPAMELICVARKPLVGTVAANILKHGTGALNIDGCRVQHLSEADRASASPGGRVTGKSGALAGKTQNDADRSDFDRPDTSKGRWPANVCHDGSDEVVSAFPESEGGGAIRVSESDKRSIFGAGLHDRPKEAMGDSGSAARFFYSAKGDNGRDGEASANRRYTDKGATNFAALPGQRRIDEGSAARFFYSSKADADDRLGSKHPTVKPVDLMRWLVRLVTPPGGTVLDPFAGSGTTGMACMAEGIDCILVEREAEYVADIKARIAHVHGLDGDLFAPFQSDAD